MRTKTITVKALVFLGLLAAAFAGERAAWAQHQGHGGMPMAAEPAQSPAEAKQARNERLTRLQEKIDAIDEKLEDQTLSSRKRAKLEKKRETLLAKKNELLSPSVVEYHHAHKAGDDGDASTTTAKTHQMEGMR